MQQNFSKPNQNFTSQNFPNQNFPTQNYPNQNFPKQNQQNYSDSPALIHGRDDSLVSDLGSIS